MAYVYRHIRLDENEPFYIGIGHDDFYKRANCKRQRNPHWSNIVKNSQYIIEILIDNISWGEACVKEIEFIKLHGRIDLKTGSLVNLTDGGEGTIGHKHTQKTVNLFSRQRKNKNQTEKQYFANCNRTQSIKSREKISKSSKGHTRHTKEQIDAIIKHNKTKIISQKTRDRWSKKRKGIKQTKEHIENNKQAKIENFITKKVMCLTNNTIYNSSKDAANKLSFGKHASVAIGSVCRGERNHYKEYKFQYV